MTELVILGNICFFSHGLDEYFHKAWFYKCMDTKARRF